MIDCRLPPMNRGQRQGTVGGSSLVPVSDCASPEAGHQCQWWHHGAQDQMLGSRCVGQRGINWWPLVWFKAHQKNPYPQTSNSIPLNSYHWTLLWFKPFTTKGYSWNANNLPGRGCSLSSTKYPYVPRAGWILIKMSGLLSIMGTLGRM